MPTLFRLVFVIGLLTVAGYGALYAIVNLVKPTPRMIVEAVVLPQSATEVRTGRSVADVLDHQAAKLVKHKRHSTH